MLSLRSSAVIEPERQRCLMYLPAISAPSTSASAAHFSSSTAAIRQLTAPAQLMGLGTRAGRRRKFRVQIAPAPPSLEVGSPEPMAVTFNSYDSFKLWLWLELYEPATSEQKELLEAVLTSWFTLGRLGGYNAQNLQVHYKGQSGKTNYTYDDSQCDTSMEAMFHDMGTPEYKGTTCRCWVNLGTADELGVDILINALNTFSQENMGIKRLTLGGDNKAWPIPKENAQAKDDPLLAGMDTGDY